MGILDSIFGGGQQEQGPRPATWHDRFQAEYAPGAYGASQQHQQQQAVYNAAMQTQGMNPQIAQALAMSPQYFGAQQGTFLPQPAQTQILTDNQNNQTFGEIRNPGGGAGHSREFSGLPITPPGTTANPAATQPAAPAQTESPSGNTLTNMPGNTNATVDALGKAVAAGQDPYALIPRGQRDTVKNVIDGKMTLSEIKQTRTEHEAGTIRKYVQAIDPNYNELKGEKTAGYIRSYMDPGSGLGLMRKTMGTSLGHVTDAVKNQIGLDNYDSQSFGDSADIGSTANSVRNRFGEQANKASQQNLQLKTASDELAKFITGKPPAEGQTNQYAALFPTSADTPRVAAGKYQAIADLLEKQMKDLETERNSNFSGKDVAKDYPIVQPEHTELLKTLHEKIAELRKQGEPQGDLMGRTVSTILGTSKNPVWGSPSTGGGWTNFRVGK